MRHLYWACEPLKLTELLDFLNESGSTSVVVGQGNGWPVILTPEPDRRLLHETARRILQGELISAAVTDKPLSLDKLFIAAEWQRKLVIERSELNIVKEFGIRVRHETDFLPHDLAIFELIEGIETDQLKPLTVRTVLAATVLQNPADYYGSFADQKVGGANVLFAAGLEAAKARGLSESQVLVGRPEAFGFSVDANNASVVAWRQKGAIAVSAFGFSLPDCYKVIDELECFGTDYPERDSIVGQVEQWMQQGLQFGLAVLLVGLEDPPVVIPMGSVYQQPVMGGHSQNLAVAHPHHANVAVGATVPLVLPAWCLNPSLAPPHGPMTATPLIFSGAGGSQSAVWSDVGRRYRGEL